MRTIRVREWTVGDKQEAERLAHELIYLRRIARKARWHNVARARVRDASRDLREIQNRYM